MTILPEDLQIDIYRGTPNVNVGCNFVRITHIPTGTVVKSEEHVPVQENQKRALEMLEEKLK